MEIELSQYRGSQGGNIVLERFTVYSLPDMAKTVKDLRIKYADSSAIFISIDGYGSRWLNKLIDYINSKE